MTPFYRAIRRLLRFALRFYYAELEAHGLERLPADGPVILAANHHNGMVDPLFLIALSPRPVRFIAKEPLFRIPVLGFFMRRLGCIPAWRVQDRGYDPAKNEGLFASVGEALAAGGVVGIFPEGRSHTDPGLAEFKHGAAKMALEAEARTGLGLKIVPVGIHFERTRLFRGRVLVTFGDPVAVADRREAYQADARAATGALTADLRDRLAGQVLQAESEELVRLTDLVERFGLVERNPGLLEKFRRRKLILEEYERLRRERPAEVEAVRRLLRRYGQMLRLLGTGDAQVAAEYRVGPVAARALANALLLIVGTPFLAVGAVVNAAPFWLVRLIVAMSGRDQDVRASVGLLASLVVFPAAYAAAAVACWGRVDPRIWVTLLAAGPVCGLLAVGWLERWRRTGRETGSLAIAVFRPAMRARLRSCREEILRRIETLI